MDQTERMAIERECERLIVAYTHYVDFGQAARVAELFTADGVWESPETTLAGQTAIREGFAARQRDEQRVSRHVCTNFALEVTDEDTAEGVVYLTLYRHDGDAAPMPRPLEGPYLVGHYRDRFVRVQAGGWRFAHRREEVAFLRAG